MRTSLASQGTRPFVDFSEARRLRLEERRIGGARRATVTGFETAACPTTADPPVSKLSLGIPRDMVGGVERRVCQGP